MTNIQHTYQPDYVPPPGRMVEEFIEARDISARELARRCGRSAKLVVEIIAGKAPIEPETAMQFERVLGMEASVWLNMEAAYRLHIARVEEAEALQKMRATVRRYPINELEQRGCIKATNTDIDRARELLRFFEAGNFAAFQTRCHELMAVSFRHSPAFKSDPEPLLAWLRIGEKAAEQTRTAQFERNRFMEALKSIRKLTLQDPKDFAPRMEAECAQAGVAFLVIPPFSKLRLSGIARWLTPGKGIIQQTLRHKTNDHFWFTFFHEACHLLFHSRKGLFVDDKFEGGDKEEDEANFWAANFLVPQHELEKFIAKADFEMNAVTSFAEHIGIAPGIVVGQLQNKEAVPWQSSLNKLKVHFTWA